MFIHHGKDSIFSNCANKNTPQQPSFRHNRPPCGETPSPTAVKPRILWRNLCVSGFVGAKIPGAPEKRLIFRSSPSKYLGAPGKRAIPRTTCSKSRFRQSQRMAIFPA